MISSLYRVSPNQNIGPCLNPPVLLLPNILPYTPLVRVDTNMYRGCRLFVRLHLSILPTPPLACDHWFPISIFQKTWSTCSTYVLQMHHIQYWIVPRNLALLCSSFCSHLDAPWPISVCIWLEIPWSDAELLWLDYNLPFLSWRTSLQSSSTEQRNCRILL